MKTIQDWEIIIYNEDGSFDTVRLEVPGGWLVKCYHNSGNVMNFVPDPEHSWELETK